MYVFSAADAVSPAIQRTRDFLFRPFRWGTYLKLGLVAIVTEGVGSNVHSSSNSSSSTGPGPHSFPGFHLTPMMIATIVAAVLLAMVVAFFVCYLITRLRFAFFHCLIHNSKEIGPGWRMYSAQALRELGPRAALLADAEGLAGHAEAIRSRMQGRRAQ